MIEQKIRKNKEVLALIRKGNDNLGAMGYTDHSRLMQPWWRTVPPIS